MTDKSPGQLPVLTAKDPVKGGDIVFYAGQAAEGVRQEFDGEIRFHKADNTVALRITSGGFFVTLNGQERRCEDPEGVYKAFADFLRSMFWYRP